MHQVHERLEPFVSLFTFPECAKCHNNRTTTFADMTDAHDWGGPVFSNYVHVPPQIVTRD